MRVYGIDNDEVIQTEFERPRNEDTIECFDGTIECFDERVCKSERLNVHPCQDDDLFIATMKYYLSSK